jgi:xylulokinase
MLADISGQQLDFRTGGDVGPALGRRGWRSWRCTGKPFSQLLPQLPLEQAHRLMRALCSLRRSGTFRQIYQQLLPLMS